EQQRKLKLTPELPQEILEDLELPRPNLKKLCATFSRTRSLYDGGRWTRSTTINKQVLADIGKGTISTTSAVQARYKDSEKLRMMADASTGMFEAIQAVIAGGEGVPHDQLVNLAEHARRQAVYGYGSAQQIDDEAKLWLDKAYGVPEYLRGTEDDDDKNLAYDPAFIKSFQATKFEQAILAKAMSPSRNPNSSFGSRGHYHDRGRGRGRGRGGLQPTNSSPRPGNDQPVRPAQGAGQ
ncbi:hypothetical protein CLU79DRAFT_714402, partial [Phycomyces nitens]